MAIEKGDAHRPGIWKQKNKAHNRGRHRGKGEINNANKGKVGIKEISRQLKQNLHRVDRRNQAQQLRSKKREETLAQKRGLGTKDSPPFLVAIVALFASEDPFRVLEVLKTCDETAIVTTSERGYVHISLPRFKQRICFFVPRHGDLHSVLDAAKVADTLMLVYDVEEGIDGCGEMLLSALFSQGLPSTVHIVQGLNKVVSKRRNEVRRNLQKIVESRFPKEKVQPLDTNQDAVLALRFIGNQKQRQITYRDRRAHLLGESLSFDLHNEKTSEGTLKVSGYLRGRLLDVNGLVYIPGWGDYQMTKILKARHDPHPVSAPSRNGKKVLTKGKQIETMELAEQMQLLAEADPLKQQSLQSENIPDAMDNEQTWPTEEELEEAEASHLATKKTMKKVVKGMSEYQSAWIVENENEGNNCDDNDDDDDSENEVHMEDPVDEKSVLGSEDEEENDEEYETMTVSEANDQENYDDDIDMDEEQRALVKIKAARLDAMFPDEVDTPVEVPARVRFQRYQGLKSFRTSPWHPDENLPFDYSRIFRFQNFALTKKRVLADKGEATSAGPQGASANTEDVLKVGQYITIHIANVPKHVFDAYSDDSSPLVVYGLLDHEQKISVVNMVIKRIPTTEGVESEPIKSKEKLTFHVGYRRFTACPIFSQHTNGDKHKYERFLRSDVPSVATVYAPVVFPPCSVLVFKEEADGTPTLVATGSVQGVNPDRIVVKRVRLSGHPFKINRKAAVVRYMFFNIDDINWFKPVELRTKYGRRGHIKEPLGTHGHMKCVFDGPLKSQDTVLMNLYKRVYPKWTYDPYVSEPPKLHFIDTKKTSKVRFAMDSSDEEDSEMITA